jgi:hypothetical protein
MCRFLVFLALITVIPALCGCGGTASSPSPFAGHWTGTWSDAGNSQSGQLQGNVAFDGAMAGTISNDTLVANGTFSGSISPDGSVHVTIVYAGPTYTGVGSFSLAGNGHLAGPVSLSDHGLLFGTSSFDLVRN